ncbi:S8 family serine peptidase [Actinoplanes subtropicus]|uniref:S8 family serine peptidase n=1 Tax=Actinoplanes subtropicus TaxID=543632 RepID=UPI0004C411A5|nr:S8 family serine peptidase [Actinoplanes subtropicus]
MRMRLLGTLLTAAAVTTAGMAAPAQAASSWAAEGRVFGVDAAGAIPGQYIVTLKSPAGELSAQSIGGATYVKKMTATEARRLAARPNVAYVEQDRLMHVEATQRNPVWGLDRIDQRAVKPSKSYTPMDDGSSVHAYVIDTGIRITHSEFGGRASYGWDFVDDDATASDCNGHGTHVAGTIGGAHYGVAKKVKLVAVRVLDCDGSGTLSSVIAGVDWVTANAQKPAVANMSLGGGRSASLEAAVQRSIDSGVTYAVAAGNDDTNAGQESPAALPAAITVAASDSTDHRAYFSNYGSVVDLFAPGVNVRSSFAGSDTATAVASGTSMATPHVTGAAALVLDAAPGYTPAQVRNFLVAHATTGKIKDAEGSPNRLLFVPAPPAQPVIKSAGLTVTVGQPFSATLAASRRGTWSVVAGKLPDGLKLSAGGVVSGTPVAPGTATVKVRFVDYVPYTVTKVLNVTVRKSVPVLSTGTLPAGTTGVDYSAQLTADRLGAWELTAGALPDGLTLAADGTITGVPTTPGASTFTVGFTDGWGSRASAQVTLQIG